jgi:hypothetical protein
MAVKQLPKISDLPEPPDRLVGDQERFDVLTFNSLKAQKKMVNDDLNKTLIPALNEFAVDVNASVDAAALSERNAHDSEEVAKRKAGEASGSAGAAKVSEDNAKVSETNALASKNAAALSAESAESARIAAEAARDEAQDLANVGYASESRAGLAKVDGKTTQADAGGVITVKDVAIGGDLGDLASARGQIGDNIRINTASDLNAYTKAGNWLFSDAAAGENFPNIGRGGELNCYVSTTAIFQFFTEFNNNRRYIRYGIPNSTWTNWIQFISVAQLGDGIRNTNGIISVPEYEGATASSAGTSGLVPPAAAGQHESFLTGGGEYKPALTKISDSVDLANSTTAASAKAVKTAYDRGSAGIAAAGEAKGTADRALNAANTAQSSADGALAAANDAQKTANAKVGFYGANSIDIGYQNGMAYYNVNETDIKKIAPYETGYATARAAQGNAVYVPSGGTWYFEAIMFRIDDACTVAEQAWFAMNQSFCSVVPGGTKIIDTTATTGCLAFCKKIL